ncbi:AbrB/MazE/SpoVT family DNA-binding domain-containing protein [Paenibacillus terrae]|uniref:SpoVT-AbrB domain-containing protein n=1 Tax=Paenibacillus terrae TaxID=159743 RepID=A0A0D7WU07_9BACL|nr:AbrB/MazE/SpoVT family DNA-binding domain-containing protein [Paenibacillus terrae]KJD42479.1 hypothetical protein QD47_27990 [Paenibacillus terrae]
MKNTGMTRPLDNLGRIVVPKEIRQTIGIDIGNPLEFFADGEVIILQKYTTRECEFCGALDTLSYYKKKFICKNCLDGLHGKPMNEIPKTEGPKQSRTPLEEMIKRLGKLIEKYPDKPQKFYAEKLEISQGRVSQLKKMI